MTLAVVWYREKFGQLWCAADSRISGKAGVLTDSGPKIFPIPVNCYEPVKPPKFRVRKRHSFGFAYAGSTLSAMSTHSIASTCTQNLLYKKGSELPVSIESIAELYKAVAQNQVVEMSSRIGALDNLQTYLFDCLIFGYCPRYESYKAYYLKQSVGAAGFQIEIVEFITAPGNYLPIGSGEKGFVRLMHELRGHPEAGVLTTLKEMVGGEMQADVGGYLQIGCSDKQGFKIMPIMNTGDEPGKAFISFLGMDATSDVVVDGFTIGYSAIKP